MKTNSQSLFPLLVIASVLSTTLLLNGCRRFEAKVPDGFAAYDDGINHFRAVSPDGVVYRVRTEKNSPEAKVVFWREALKKRMLDAGYIFTNENDITAGQIPGYLLELAAPVGLQDYGYLIALFVSGSRLIIVEASGEVLKLKNHRDAILNSINALKI
ncbi:MAG: hypothetical protein JW841_00935 [Deltaproteobacteria bacterium]|nr:hypothetical protein [Deltaproteobacteria bacterium]